VTAASNTVEKAGVIIGSEQFIILLLRDEQTGERIIHVDTVDNKGDEFSARLKRTSEFPLPLQR
jgi:hypothetical protein